MAELDLLTPGDVAKIAAVTPATVRMWADRGRLASIRTAGNVRLFERSAVNRFVEARRLASAAPSRVRERERLVEGVAV